MTFSVASPVALTARSALRSRSSSRLAVPSRPAFGNRRMASSRLAVSASADGAFDSYSPKVAFLFPGQGAQFVGMAKVRNGSNKLTRLGASILASFIGPVRQPLRTQCPLPHFTDSCGGGPGGGGALQKGQRYPGLRSPESVRGGAEGEARHHRGERQTVPCTRSARYGEMMMCSASYAADSIRSTLNLYCMLLMYTPPDAHNAPQVSQPAIYVASLAAVEKLKVRGAQAEHSQASL